MYSFITDALDLVLQVGFHLITFVLEHYKCFRKITTFLISFNYLVLVLVLLARYIQITITARYIFFNF